MNRERLAELADELIPAEGDMPSASAAGAVGEWLDAVLRARPDFEVPLGGLEGSTAGLAPAEAIAALPERDPAGWSALTAAVVAAYYMNPDVCARIGYAGQQALPLDPDARPDYLQAGLLHSVKSRGPVYRATP